MNYFAGNNRLSQIAHKLRQVSNDAYNDTQSPTEYKASTIITPAIGALVSASVVVATGSDLGLLIPAAIWGGATLMAVNALSGQYLGQIFMGTFAAIGSGLLNLASKAVNSFNDPQTPADYQAISTPSQTSNPLDVSDQVEALNAPEALRLLRSKDSPSPVPPPQNKTKI